MFIKWAPPILTKSYLSTTLDSYGSLWKEAHKTRIKDENMCLKTHNGLIFAHHVTFVN